jgi:hypothetical protein
LRVDINSLILRSETYRVTPRQPGFVRVRLLNRPTANVTVHCALDKPKAGILSAQELLFTPANFDIEQTVRIQVADPAPNQFVRLMVGAVSTDRIIDGSHGQHALLLNEDATEEASAAVIPMLHQPGTMPTASIAPTAQPIDLVDVHVMQQDIVTETITFTPEQYEARAIRLYPTQQDYSNGVLQITLHLESADRRFHGRIVSHDVQLPPSGESLPDVQITEPQQGAVLEGPAFVTATAQATPAQGIKETSVFMGSKRMGRSSSATCTAGIEQGPPPSRLSAGNYTIWATATDANGMVIATPPVSFTVRN